MKRIILTMGFLLALAAGARADATLPSTPIGARLKGFVEIMNSQDDAAARRFIQENYTDAALKTRSIDDRLEAWHGLFEDLGHPVIKSVDVNGPGMTALVLESKDTGRRFQLRFNHDPEGAQKLAGIMVMPAPPVELNAPGGKLSDTQIASELDTLMKGLVDKDRFSGSVLVAHDGKPIFEGAWGEASKSFNVPNTVETKFNLGSMNKMFTALSIAQLAEAGKLSFDDPVGKYLPDFPNKAIRDKVTIHHLLTHTSGMGSYFESPIYQTTWPGLRKVADYLPIVAADSLAFEPGARMQYSNSGFVVLGLIIEKVSGEDYYDYVRKHIFEPAGMTNTDSYQADQIVPNLAVGYTRIGEGGHQAPMVALHTNIFEHSARGTPAGGGFSTAPDLLKFDQALRTNKLLGPKYTEILLQGKVPMGPEVQYAYGFGDERRNGHRSVGHNGGAPGINADFKCYLDLGYTSVVLSNYDQAAGMVADQIDELVRR